MALAHFRRQPRCDLRLVDRTQRVLQLVMAVESLY